MEPIDYYNKYKLITIPLIPNDKRPYLKEWQKLTKSKKGRDGDNIGAITGKVNNITVIDIDKKDNGMKIFKKWIKEYGEIDVPTVKTGDGLHLYFKYDKDLKSSLKIKINDKRIGIDIKSDGGQIVIPPSMHPNGKEYKWIKTLDDYKIKKIPKWLKDKLLDKLLDK